MTWITLAFILIFWVMQIAANVAFKYGGKGSRALWIICFILGNTVGIVSIYFVMRIYEAFKDNPNLAAVLAGSVSFIGAQLVLAALFHSRLTWRQWAGITLVAVGAAATTFGG